MTNLLNRLKKIEENVPKKKNKCSIDVAALSNADLKRASEILKRIDVSKDINHPNLDASLLTDDEVKFFDSLPRLK